MWGQVWYKGHGFGVSTNPSPSDTPFGESLSHRPEDFPLCPSAKKGAQLTLMDSAKELVRTLEI